MNRGFTSRQQFDFPNIVNVCVLRGACPCYCIHCPVGRTESERRRTKFGNAVMSLPLFHKIADEMSAYKHTTLRLHAVGEPILWIDLMEALEYASKSGLKIWLFTCLITGDKRLLDGIAEYCDIIEISVNSYSAEDYKKTKGIDAFNLVIGNIDYLNQVVKNRNYKAKVIVSRVESEDDQYDAGFKEYWKNSHIVDDVFVRSYHDYNSELKGRMTKDKSESVPCLVHWARFNIDCDGTAVLCFNELFKGRKPSNDVVLGDINKSKISDIWHGDKLNSVRLAQLENDYSLVTFSDRLPCRDCCFCQPLIGGRNATSEFQIARLKGGQG